METLYNGEMVAVEITAKSNLSCSRGPVTFLGYPIARAFDRDSGAKLGTGVSMIEGDITSGGSRANWTSNVDKGSVFRLQVPKKMLDKLNQPTADKWDIKLIKVQKKRSKKEK